MNFDQRPPSVGWEAVSFPECPQCCIWVWFKPGHIPFGLSITVPDETWAMYPTAVSVPLTMRRLLQIAGTDPAFVATWCLGGAVYDAMRGTNPLLDHPVPRPVPGTDPAIAVHLMPQQPIAYQQPPAMQPMAMPPQQPSAPAASNGQPAGNMEAMFEAIEKDWTACKEGLRDLDRMRKQLVDINVRLKNLDRELNSNERRFSSTQDKKDWLEARRWLRDGMSKVLMLVKSYDIGDVSAAGRGRQVEQIYTQFIETRTPFPGLEGAQQQFVEYRKLVTTLQGRMNTAYSQSGVAAERRAQKVMKSIQAKVRKGTTRTSFLDAISDG